MTVLAKREKDMNRSWLAYVTLAMLTEGCMLGGLHIDQVATSIQKPSNVAIYMAITKGDDAVHPAPAALPAEGDD